MRRILGLVTALVVALPIHAAPADKAPAQQISQSATPTLKVFTREVVVDIIVTDAVGKPIRNLKQSDFTIEEDGKPQPIRAFSESGSPNSAPPAPTPAAPALPSGLHTNLQTAASGGPVNILLLDGLHLNFASSARTLQAASAYAASMPRGTQLAVFWLGTGGLHMLQGLTTDPTAAQQALSAPRADIGNDSDCYQADRLTIYALNQIADYVANTKGRKNLIWVTSGIPVFLLRDGGQSWGSSTSCHNLDAQRAFGGDGGDGPSLFTGPDGQTTEGLDMTQVHHLMDTYETFSAEQIAVSPLDANGVVPGGLSGMTLVAEQVAQQSGGIAAYNTNNLAGAVASIVNQSSNYYTIAYVPPRSKDDGHYHAIKVNLDIRGAHLVYRVGYNAEDPRQPRQFSGPDLIKAALEGKTPAASQIVFDAKLTPAPNAAPIPAAKPKGKSAPTRTVYDLYLAVPQNQITYAKNAAGDRTVNLQFAFDASDVNGKQLGSHAQNVARTMPLDQFAEFIREPVIFHEQLAFFPGPLFLRVGILDHTSNRVGTLEIPLTVPQPGAINHDAPVPPCPPRCPLPAPSR